MDYKNLASQYGGSSANFSKIAEKYGGNMQSGMTATQLADQKSAQENKALFPNVTGNETVMSGGLKALGNTPGSFLNTTANLLKLGGQFLLYDNPISKIFNIGQDKSVTGMLGKVATGAVGATMDKEYQPPEGSILAESKDVFEGFAQAMRERFGPVEGYIQLGEELIKGKIAQGIPGNEAANEVLQTLQRTFVNDPFGGGLDVYGGLELGAGALGKTEQLRNLSNKTSKLVTAPAEDVKNLAGAGASKVKEGVQNKITPMEKGVENVLEQQTGIEKFDDYMDTAKKAAEDYHLPTPLEKAGEKAGESLDVMQGLMKKAGEIKREIVSTIGNKNTGRIVDNALYEFRNQIAERIGGAFTSDGELIQLPGRALVLSDRADLTLLETTYRKLLELQTNKSFRAVDDVIDSIQGILYKARQMGAVPINKNVESLIKRIIGQLNDELKTFGGLEYRGANNFYSEVKNIFDELNRALGPNEKRGGSLMKRVFSPTDGGTKKLFNQVKALTGIDLVDEATLAKLAMEIAGDARQASLLEQLELLRIPGKGSFIMEAGKKILNKLQDTEGKARSIIEKATGKKNKVNLKTPEAYSSDIQPGLSIKDVSGKVKVKVNGKIEIMDVKDYKNWSRKWDEDGTPYEFIERVGKTKGETLSTIESDIAKAKASGMTLEEFKLQQTLRGTKGMTAEQITQKHPDIILKKDVPAKDIYGNKVEIPKGEELTPYELKGNKVVLQDGQTYVVSKGQFQNIKGNSTVAEATDFAPELKGLEETVKTRGGWVDGKQVAETSKYSQYQLPGGENYKEILIKAPSKKRTAEIKTRMDNIEEQLTYPDNGLSETEKISLRKEFKSLADEERASGVFQSSHWDEPNVISHLRLNDRTYKGKKVTFMEELQSDWARELRSGNTEATNPLVKGNKWQEPSIKRALKDAVDNDSDYFAWITGEQTSARYNLSKQLESVRWEKVRNGSKMVDLKPKDGGFLIDFTVDKKGIITRSNDWQGKKLDEVLGKGLADSIMSKETGTLSGEGLKFGGEWAENLYDRQVKNIVEKLTGAKAEKLDLGLPIDKSSETWSLGGRANRYGREPLKISDLKVGETISKSPTASGEYIITDILGDGKFKAVPKSRLSNITDNPNQYIKDIGDPEAVKARIRAKNPKGDVTEDFINKRISEQKYFLNSVSETFDISTKTTTQQGIKLTPEIKAKIKGEALETNTSGKLFDMTDAELKQLWDNAL